MTLALVTLHLDSCTLSGGEAQRIKLAKELSKEVLEKHYLFWTNQQPGFIRDIELLLEVLKTSKPSNTIVVIEHNLDVIKTADGY